MRSRRGSSTTTARSTSRSGCSRASDRRMPRRSSSTACSRGRRGRTSSFATRTPTHGAGRPTGSRAPASSCDATRSCELGGLDEGFFMYCEDIDLCRRLRSSGYELVFEPAASVVHLGGASAPRAALLPTLAASRVRYARKHRGRAVAFLERVGVGLGAATHALVGRGGRAARAGHARALLAAAKPVATSRPARVEPPALVDRGIVAAEAPRVPWDEPCGGSAEWFGCAASLVPSVVRRPPNADRWRA